MSINITVIVIGVVVLLLVFAFPCVLIWLLVGSLRAKRLAVSLMLTVVTLAVVGLYARVIYAVAPLGDKLVASTTCPGGMELVLFQKCNYSTEPYHTRFYFREPEAPWHSFQIDFEDTRWISGWIEIDLNADLATVYRGKDEVARFNLSTHAFTMGNYTQTNAYVYPETATTPWKE